MSFELGPVDRGPKWMRDAFNKRDQYALSITPLKGLGTAVTYSYGGRAISSKGRRGRGTSVSFQLYNASTSAGLKIGVRAGFVDGSGQGYADFPQDMNAGDSPAFSLPVTATGIVYLHVEIVAPTDTDPAEITNITVETSASLPANTDTNGYGYLGSYTVGPPPRGGANTILSFIGAAGDKGYVYCNGHFFWAM